MTGAGSGFAVGVVVVALGDGAGFAGGRLVGVAVAVVAVVAVVAAGAVVGVPAGVPLAVAVSDGRWGSGASVALRLWPTRVAEAPTTWSGVQAAVAATRARAPVRSRARPWPFVARDGELAACILTPCRITRRAVRRCTALRVTRRPRRWLSEPRPVRGS